MILNTGCNENDKPKLENEDNVVAEDVQKKEEEKPQDTIDPRNNWQKPGFIISQLGDLEGKVVADIGAGELGYFVFKLIKQSKAKHVIAIDIDPEAVKVLDQIKSALPANQQDRLSTRLAQENDPKLEPNEVDIALIVNTIAYISNRLDYFRNLRKNLKEGGKVVIVDFKTKRIPDSIEAPLYEYRAYLHVVEEELYEAGFSFIETDDTNLEYQYRITAHK